MVDFDATRLLMREFDARQEDYTTRGDYWKERALKAEADASRLVAVAAELLANAQEVVDQPGYSVWCKAMLYAADRIMAARRNGGQS